MACDDTDSSIGGINIFPISKDKELGSQLDVEMKKDTKEYPILVDSRLNSYLNGILSEILASPNIEHKNDFQYSIQIVKRDDVINAFATPGGYVYVYTGLLKFVDSKAELAAIMAHEVAHCERRHATSRMTTQYGISVVLGLLLGDNPSQLEQMASNLFTSLGLLKNSRDDEYEADKYAFRYLQSTKYYPGAMTYFFDRINTNKDSKPSVFETLLATHPLSTDRINAVKKLLKDASSPSASEDNLFSNEYKNNFKAYIP
jgi:predicted Zn-dependent protease